jgi:hypothetical protein
LDIPRGRDGEKDLDNEHSAGGIPPSSKSRSKRTLVARAHHHRSRRNDGATRIPQSKRANAQKHGFFAACPIIAGEDPREFEALHSALFDEWQPSGPSEEDAVFSLADLMWRKHRAQRFVQAKVKAATFYASSPTFDETRGLALFVHFMDLAPEVALENCGNLLLSPDRLSHLKQKFPRSNYQSTTDWAEAIQMEIHSVLYPAAAPEPEKKLDEAVVKLMSEWLMAHTVHHATEFLDDELKLRERLEAMIDRKIKHLIQLKAMKQMLRQTSGTREDEQPKRITAYNR